MIGLIRHILKRHYKVLLGCNITAKHNVMIIEMYVGLRVLYDFCLFCALCYVFVLIDF